jgi:hypothetical protein
MKNSLACVIFKEKKSTIFAIIFKNVFKDNAVKKFVRMGQSLMIINIFFPLKTLSNVLLYFEIRNSLLSTL